MITFELNNPDTFTLTTTQLRKIAKLVASTEAATGGKDLRYDVVEGDTGGIVWLWVHHEAGNPTRYWIDEAAYVTFEEVTWDWKGLQP